MSTVFIIKREKIETPYGFKKLNYNTFYYFESNQYGKSESLAVSSEGEVVFPEDYSNKREYLKKVRYKGRQNTAENALDYYRLRDEALALIKSLGKNTAFCVKDITDIEEPVNEYISILMDDLNRRSLFVYGNYYIV